MTEQRPERRPDQEGQVSVAGGQVIAVGEFDRSNVARLRAALEEVAARVGQEFVIDLTGVTYLDSSVLSALWQHAERQPRIVVRRGALIERVLARSGFAELGVLDVQP